MSEGLRFWLGLGPAMVSGLAVAGFAVSVPLPNLSAAPDAMVLGVAGAAMALGLGYLIPERWLHSESARLSHAFKSHHGVSDDRAEVALRAVQSAHAAAMRLRRADNGFQDGLAKSAAEAADRLDEVARLVFYKPDELPKYQALVIRADSVIGAVEDHAKVRSRAVDEAEVAASREMAQSGLQSLHGALDASRQKEVAAILDRIEVNVATAETLLRPRS